MRRISDKFSPQLLVQEQKENSFSVASYLL